MYYRPFLLWAIIAGLLAKFVYVRYLTRLAWSKCAVVDVAMNVASALLNLVAVPAAFLKLEINSFASGVVCVPKLSRGPRECNSSQQRAERIRDRDIEGHGNQQLV
jgi:hypothetical protein